MSDPITRANAIFLRDVAAERLRWLSPGRLATGKLTVLDGDPGLGKSTLLCDWAARTSMGQPLPDGEAGQPRGVVLLSAEDGLGDTIRPRLEAAGADLSRIIAMLTVPDGTPEGRFPELPLDVPYIRELIARVDAALLVIDPLMAYLGASVNSWRDQDARRALAPLATMADETDVAVVVLRHLNKAQSANALYRGGGSIGIIGAARCGLLVAADPDDPDRRILATTKTNLSRPPASLTFTLEPVPGRDVARVVYGGTSGLSASDLLSAPQDDEGRAERDQRHGARQEAETWLLDLLYAGPVASRDVIRKARADGIAERTLERAKAALEVKAERTGGLGETGSWTWSLPRHATTPNGANTGTKDAKSANGHQTGSLRETIDSTGIFDDRSRKAATAPIYGDVGGLGGLSGDLRPAGAIWTCAECGLPRSTDDRPCPNCNATAGRWFTPEVA